MQKIRVGVLRGGPSREYEVSLKTGSTVLKNLPEEKYETRDILITRDGVWHHRGLPIEPKNLFPHVDVLFNALHGEYGEDGGVQQLLSHFNVPYTGSRAVASALCMNKANTKVVLEPLGIKSPYYIVLDVSDILNQKVSNLFRTFPQPSVIKPISSGSSIGVTVAHDYDSFMKGIRKAFESSSQVIIEKFIQGKEATCGIVDNFRGEEYYSLLPIEIIPDSDRLLFDYEAKYEGKSQELCPGNFSQEESVELQRLAREVHKNLGLRHYSRSDFIIAQDGIYFLEVNTLPGLTSDSLVPKSLKAAGAKLSEFLDHVVTLALDRK